MLDAIDKELLKAVAELEGLPRGAYNIRKNGRLLSRETTAAIEIESNAAGDGINIRIRPGTRGESVHIPVILSQAGLYDVVTNNFFIGEAAEVVIVAGCGIHCGGEQPEGHAGLHEFRVGRGARLRYVEKHFAGGSGTGRRLLNPTTRVWLGEGAQMEMELTQLGGVDEARRVNEATLAAGSSLRITERVMTEGGQQAESRNTIVLEGEGSRAEFISRAVIRGESRQTFQAVMEARARAFGHLQCDAIVMDHGTSETVPALRALHPEAELTHEAAIGRIADEQLLKLMSLGLDYDAAVREIIHGFLRR